MHTSKPEMVYFFAFLGITSVLVFFVFQPFLQTLSLAAVLAVLFHSSFERLARTIGDRSIAAGAVVAIVLIFLIIPTFFLGSKIFVEARDLYAHIAGNETGYVHAVQGAIEAPIRRIVPGFTFSIDIGSYASSLLGFASGNLGNLVTQTVSLIFDTFLVLLSFFFFLRDGRAMVSWITRKSPFRADHTKEILDNMHRTISAVVRGTLVIGLIRLFIIGILFFAFGIPNAILWGSVGGIIGAIPGIGTLLVIIPAAAYVYLAGNTLSALALLVLGLGVTGFVDNMLGPYFFGKGLDVQPIFILFAILGGILFLGPIGFILGPLILSLFLSALHMYSVIVPQKGEVS